MYYFIVNTHGGSGRAYKTWKYVEKLLKKRHISYEMLSTNYPGHATELTSSLCCRDDQNIRIVIVGGDGTINEVLNGITDFQKVSIGVIPTGSGNDFARGAGISKNTKKALARILDNTIHTIDIGVTCTKDATHVVTKRYFAISSGFGMDAIVCKRALTSRIKTVLNFLHLGGLTYIVLTIQTLFSMKMEKVAVVLNAGLPDEHKLDFANLIFLACMNFKAEGGGVPMAPDASAEDGLLSICCAYGIPKLVALLEFPLLILGKHRSLQGFYCANCKTVDVQTATPLVVHLDGEYGGDVQSLHFACLPRKLRLL